MSTPPPYVQMSVVSEKLVLIVCNGCYMISFVFLSTIREKDVANTILWASNVTFIIY